MVESLSSRNFQAPPWLSLVAYWAGFTLLAALLNWGHLVDQDEGLTLAGAWRVSLGQAPYTAEFFDFVTPGSFYFLAAAFRLFGSTYAVAKIFSIGLLALAGYGMARIGRYLGLGQWRFLPPVMWLLLINFYPLINHNTYALISAVWAVERLLWAHATSARASGWARYLVAGGLAAATVLQHQGRGAAVVVAGGVWLASGRQWRGLAAWISGVALVLLPLTVVWPLPALWYHMVVFPVFHYYPSHSGGFWLWPVAGLAGYVVMAWLPRRWWHPPAVWRLVWLVGVMLVFSTFSQPDRFHVVPALFPAALLVVYAVANRRHLSRPLRFTVTALLTAVLAAAVVTSQVIVTHRAREVGWKNFVRLKDPALGRLVAYLRQEVAPTQPLLVVPMMPNFYFEAQLRNPTPYNVLLVGQHPPAFFAAARNQLAANPPPVILTNYGVSPADFSQYLLGNPVADFIRENYQYVMTVNNVQVYHRVSPPSSLDQLRNNILRQAQFSGFRNDQLALARW